MPWNAGRITDFQPSVDRLDLSGLYANGYWGSDPVADRFVSFVADGAGGTKVMMDVDGPSGPSPISFHVVTLQGVASSGLTPASVFGGGESPAPATGGSAGQWLAAPYPGASVRGGAGADTLAASQGSDQLSGGAGADHFLFAQLPWNAGRVTDFQDGVDRLDLRPLFAGSDYWGADPVADGYLRLRDDGRGGTAVSFDRDGWADGERWPTTITTLESVSV